MPQLLPLHAAKQERNTLRSSLNLLESAVAARSCSPQQQQQQQAADEVEGAADRSTGSSNSRPGSPLIIGGGSSSTISASELERLKALQAAVPGVSGAEGFARYSGAQAASLAQQQAGGSGNGRAEGTHSRAVMQQLHEAGMQAARRRCMCWSDAKRLAAMLSGHVPTLNKCATRVTVLVMHI
jgi:hypothetical protein